ncbi:BppU family phage baseplate upper protein [Enterococcus durans]|uniref:BppU family phage baseplate upper protein n=1 Tax=Enterococcus durans TaxID=53345 RepID=UPI00115F0A57|nr:BppU family phage baseplate upper protein [Enterococcus durans]
MAHVIKKGSITVSTQPKDYDLQATGLVFKSYDNQIALEFNVEQQNGTPADLLGANLRLLMFIYDEVDGMITKEPIPFITKNLITESFLNGQVVYILPEAMKAYNGMVEAYVYIEYPDGSTSDNLGFTFRMKRSTIDGLAQDKADYFIADFQQLLDGVKQEATDAVNEVLAKVEAVSKNVSSAQNDLTILEDRIDQTNQQIGELGQLKRMYANSIDFGDYDYSGNANLFLNPTFSDLSLDTKIKKPVQSFVTDNGESFTVDLTAVTGGQAFYINNLPTMLKSTSYTYSIEAKADIDLPNGVKVRPGYFDKNGRMQYPFTTIIPNMTTSYKRYSYTQTNLPLDYLNSNFHYLQFYFPADVPRTKITIKYNIKTEKGTEATPYQPNLLVEPYNMCREYPNENIANKSVAFPIKSSAYLLYEANMEEEFIIGQTYTITLKGTKPASQTFAAFNHWNILGNLKPVEGLTDVWSLTFTPTKLEPGLPKDIRIYQSPQSTAGACQIDWLKIEKGNTRTPNISQFKYFGEGLKDSNNPNDYSWDITPEYAEKSLNNTVSLTEPETVLGLKNFEDGIQIAGDRVVGENEHTIYKLDKSNSNSFIDGYATFIKHGKIVIVNGTVKFKKAYAFGVPLDDEVPEEFIARGVNGMIIGASGTSNSAKMIYVRQGFKSIMTNSEFAINEWFTFNGVYWVGEE